MPELTVRVYKSTPAQQRANRVYREANRQKIRDIAKRYYEKNKASVSEKRRARYHANKALKQNSKISSPA